MILYNILMQPFGLVNYYAVAHSFICSLFKFSLCCVPCFHSCFVQIHIVCICCKKHYIIISVYFVAVFFIKSYLFFVGGVHFGYPFDKGGIFREVENRFAYQFFVIHMMCYLKIPFSKNTKFSGAFRIKVAKSVCDLIMPLALFNA